MITTQGAHTSLWELFNFYLFLLVKSFEEDIQWFDDLCILLEASHFNNFENFLNLTL